MDLDRQAVHVDGQAALAVAAPLGTKPPARQLGDRLPQHAPVPVGSVRRLASASPVRQSCDCLRMVL